MNDEQKTCFRSVYKFLHDERANCQNLAGLIDIAFPKRDGTSLEFGELIGDELREIIKPYLQTRGDLGVRAMDLMYMLQDFIRGETGEVL